MRRYSALVLVLAWMATCVYWVVPETHNGFLFVVTMTIITGIWLSYAIGTNGIILNNRIVKYLSGISMEIYLSHMMSFRAVQFLHIDKYVENIYIVFWVTCLLTLCVAIVFSHVVKYLILPKFSNK